MTSETLDSVPSGMGFRVEGFLGVTDPTGISQLTIFNNINTTVFELDHIQISTTPIAEPSTLLLLGTGLAAAAYRGRRNH